MKKIFTQEKVIFLVDDSHLFREFVRLLLEREGYKVITFADGIYALHMLRNMHPDMIISDIDMPILDGLALSDRIEEKYPDAKRIPLLYMTGSLDSSVLRKAEEKSRNMVFKKPFLIDPFLSMVEKILLAPPKRRLKMNG